MDILILSMPSRRLAQQPMTVSAYFAHPSILDDWELRCMSRCLDLMVSLKRDPPAFKSSSKLITHLSTHCSRDERRSRPFPAWE
ncbi:hypothetical protein TNCV_2661261 [Trichonephila clavipes]|nr:hypothetical protein TNCV_2661261 [Trichonephila clavipes]